MSFSGQKVIPSPRVADEELGPANAGGRNDVKEAAPEGEAPEHCLIQPNNRPDVSFVF